MEHGWGSSIYFQYLTKSFTIQSIIKFLLYWNVVHLHCYCFLFFLFFFTCRATNPQPFSENVNLLQFDEHRYMESAILHVRAVYCSQCTNIYGSYCKECYNKTVTWRICFMQNWCPLSSTFNYKLLMVNITIQIWARCFV